MKKCKQYSLFDLVRLQNGWQWFRGPREFDGKLLTLTNGSLQTNAEVASPREEQGTLPDGKEKLFEDLTFALLAGKQLTGSF